MPNAVEFIKEHITKEHIIELLEQNGARSIQDMGEQLRCTCPLHGGDNPTAFVWNLENKMWFCFTGDCGGGDVFSFVADILDLSVEHEFKTVVFKTAEMLHIDISHMELGERADRNRRELREWIDYVSRGHRHENAAYDMSKLGRKFALNSYRNFTRDTLELFQVRYAEAFNRILVPIFNADGAPIGASLRKINEEEAAKWLHRPKHINTREVIYNIHNIPVDNDTLVVCEGCFDVMNLWQIGIKNAGATFGAHMTDEQVDIICSRFINVILAYDADDAGKGATKKAIELLKYKVNLSILDLPSTSFHDPGEIDSIEAYNAIQILKPYQYISKY